ncbi:hypothetical protein [Ornithinibacillus xuwenensis]|uniref:Uncharacterized protein n=1 Tax=Ornithinibacillus xuwenensis TaxID=3144668 RepID=A0ABU9XEB7_9BACI
MFYMIGIVDWIKFSHLNSLGIEKEVLYVILIFIGILASHIVIRPLTAFLITLQSERLLSYVLSSLSYIVLFFIAVLFIGKIDPLTYQLFKFSLQILGILGFVILIIQLLKQVLKRRRKV